MTTKQTYRTTLNGAKWMIEEDKWGATLYLKNYNNDGYHFSGDLFKSVAEVNAYLDGIDKAYLEPKKVVVYEVPADFYGVAGRYYGD